MREWENKSSPGCSEGVIRAVIIDVGGIEAGTLEPLSSKNFEQGLLPSLCNITQILAWADRLEHQE